MPTVECESMIGQYTEKEVMAMEDSKNSLLKLYLRGIIARQVGNTVNYYKKESDGSWTNYKCRTVDR